MATIGIVAWQSCLEEDGPLAQNVEAVTSHVGMGHHLHRVAIISVHVEDDQIHDRI